MTYFEIYAFFGAPLVILAVGYAMYRIASNPNSRW